MKNLVRLPNQRHVRIAQANGHKIYERAGVSAREVVKPVSTGTYFATVDYTKKAA